MKRTITKLAILDGAPSLPMNIRIAKEDYTWNSNQSTTRKFLEKEEEKVHKTRNMISNIPKIEDSFPQLETYPDVTERYYKQMYYIHGQPSSQEHHCVLVHSNKICLISLAPSHPILKEKKKILRIDFQVSNKLDRLENKVRGKGKKGGQHITPDSVLCHVECMDGIKYPIWGCIKGKLVEINQLLLKNPDLMIEKPLSQGFIAIILPSIKDFEVYIKNLLPKEKYENEFLTQSICN